MVTRFFVNIVFIMLILYAVIMRLQLPTICLGFAKIVYLYWMTRGIEREKADFFLKYILQ